MKRLQQFVEKKKVDHKFKQAGSGHRLDEQRQMPVATSSQQQQVRVTPAPSAARAGEAALARLQPDRPASAAKMKQLKAKAAAEREAEQAAMDRMNNPTVSSRASGRSTSPEQPAFHDDQAPVSVSGIFYQCPLGCSPVIPKASVDEHLQMCLLTRLLPENPLEASAKMVHTYNKDKEKRQAGIDIMCKYLENVCNNLAEEKYQRIRMGNKAYVEKVACLEGSHEFLQAVGFLPKMLPHQETEEAFLVLTPEAAANIEQLRSACELLQTAQPLKASLHRDLKVYQKSSQASQFQLPQDFYRIKPEEAKRQQQLRTEEVERNAVLRTKAMKEAEALRNLRRYRYALIRVRFPNGILLQGTFHASDKLSEVFEFIRCSLINDWQPFILTDATGLKLTEEDCKLAELKLAPAAVVNFSWDAAIMEEIVAAQGFVQEGDYLKPELINAIQSL
ncbi:UBX domain-containing protein 6-like [Patiria miniata]|uniref:UBX domain-containing protein n=1 Tax=Patiria miniata TaxID=46514 RepID=A0A914BTC3_PATMI|nr:UBX domain-containing protein 6-like [Patiria miniata]